MTDVSPDTLSTARRLEHDFGMDRQASEGVAIAIYEHTTANLATKADLRQLEDTLRDELAAKADLRQVEEKLRGEIKELGATLRGEMNGWGATLRGEMNELGATLRGDMQELGTSLRGQIEGSRGYTDAKLAELRAEMHGEFKNLYRHLWLLLLGFAGLIVTLNKLLA
ncbi:MAG: hypothetical protein F4169_21815 [Gammaproteobacteria bacterium]|nr:hypothetical protein [Gammaproteobacteria bacterium]